MKGKMQSFTVTTALVFYAIILGQTPLIEAASTSRSETPSTDDSRNYDAKDARTTEYGYNPTENGNTTSTTISYYNDPWGVPTNATTTEEQPGYDRRSSPTTYGYGRTTTSSFDRPTTSSFDRRTTSSFDRRMTSSFDRTPNSSFDRRKSFSYGRTTTSNYGNDWDIDRNAVNDETPSTLNDARRGGPVSGQADNQSKAWDATTRVSTFDFSNPTFIDETGNNSAKNHTSVRIREVTLYVLPNGTAVYGFPNGTFVNSSSTAIHFPNGTVITSFPDGSSDNTTATTFLNGTTTFLLTNGTTLNSSEIFSLANGTRISYVEEVILMSNHTGTDDEEVDQRGMTTSTTRGFTTRMPRRTTTTTTTTTSAPSSSDDDDGGRRPIRRKGGIPQPAPRTENNGDETTETPSGNRRHQGNWFG